MEPMYSATCLNHTSIQKRANDPGSISPDNRLTPDKQNETCKENTGKSQAAF